MLKGNAPSTSLLDPTAFGPSATGSDGRLLWFRIDPSDLRFDVRIGRGGFGEVWKVGLFFCFFVMLCCIYRLPLLSSCLT